MIDRHVHTHTHDRPSCTHTHHYMHFIPHMMNTIIHTQWWYCSEHSSIYSFAV